MNKVNLLGISGKAGSGKDLIGKIIQYLVDHDSLMINYKKDALESGVFEEPSKEDFNDWLYNGYDIPEYNNWQIKKFAAKVKQILSILTDISIEDMEKEEVKNSYLGEEWDRYEAFLIQKRGKNKAISPISVTKEEAKIRLLQGINIQHPAWDITKIEYKTHKITVRQALQLIGTNLFRDKFHPNCWVNSLFSDYKSIIKFKKGSPYASIKEMSTFEFQKKWKDEEVYPNWIVTDLRFENEAQAIKDRGGILIRINRSYSIGVQEHKSETALDNYKEFDYIIDNSGSIEDLIRKVKDILIELKII